jgi:hypothetical protein
MKSVLGSGMLREPCEVVNITDLPHLGGLWPRAAKVRRGWGIGGWGLVFGAFVQNCAWPRECILGIGFCLDGLAEIWRNETKFEPILFDFAFSDFSMVRRAWGRGLVFGGFVQNCAGPGTDGLEMHVCFDGLAEIWGDETKFEPILRNFAISDFAIGTS